MNEDKLKSQVIEYWITKAKEALESAISEKTSGRFLFAINRAYYACFYSLSAVLLNEGQKFKKHSGVRSALHQNLIKKGKLDVSWGKFYDLVFESRQRGDYQELVEFRIEEVEEIINRSQGFIKEMGNILQKKE